MRGALIFDVIGTLFFVTTIAGCGNAVNLVPVDGVVMLEGKPLSGATVAFVPLQGEHSGGQSLTKEDGSFSLDTHGEMGVAPGEYRVIVSKFDPSTPKSATRPKSEVPLKYMSETSPLRVTVPLTEDLILNLEND